MSGQLNSVLLGAIAMASLVAALFFLRFWRQTSDRFFLWFAVAFAIDAASRFVLGLGRVSEESEPFFYIPRLVMFGLIIIAIVLKNRPEKPDR